MSTGEFVLTRPAAAAPRSDAAPRLRRVSPARAITAWAKRRVTSLRAALEAHTRRRIEFALGERVAELNRAIRANRAAETAKEASAGRPPALDRLGESRRIPIWWDHLAS